MPRVPHLLEPRIKMDGQTSDRQTSDKFECLIKEIKQLANNYIRGFIGCNESGFSESVSVRSLKYYFAALTLKTLDISWVNMASLFKTHTAVHPEFVQVLKDHCDEETEALLAQYLVRNEKLVRILKHKLLTYPHKEMILAVDGLMGNLSSGPNFDYKYYIHNLSYALNGERSVFDDDVGYKHSHCLAVRKMYRLLDVAKVSQESKVIYRVLRRVIKEITGIELPEGKMKNVETSHDENLRELYLAEMTKENIIELAKSIRWKGEKRAASDDDEVPQKFARVDEEN